MGLQRFLCFFVFPSQFLTGKNGRLLHGKFHNDWSRWWYGSPETKCYKFCAYTHPVIHMGIFLAIQTKMFRAYGPYHASFIFAITQLLIGSGNDTCRYYCNALSVLFTISSYPRRQVVTEIGFSVEQVSLCICLVFLHHISKTVAARTIKLPPWVLETHLFWGQQVKRQYHVAQKTHLLCVFRQKAILPLAAYVVCWVFPTAQAMLATPGFPCVTSSQPMLLLTATFPCVFHSSQPAAKHSRRGSWHSSESWFVLVRVSISHCLRFLILIEIFSQ